MDKFKKYFKPNSLTWWASFVPFLAGVFMAFEPVHGMGAMSDSISTMFNNASPGTLINAGLAGIGLRGAMG